MSQIKKNWKAIAIVLIFFFAVAFPFLTSEQYMLHMITYSLIWVIMTQGLNVIQGWTGYVSIAQASFFGIGAYTSALLTTQLGMSFWVTLPIAVLVSAVAGLLVGYPALRTKGHYFSILTMGFCIVFWILLMTLNNITGGESGISRIPVPDSIFGIDFSNKTSYYFLVLFFASLTVLFMYRLKNSRMGRAFITIRTSEPLAQAMGISVVRYKVLVFVVSATFGGLAGCLYAHFQKYINPVPFSTEYSMNAILAVIMGGSGTVIGPIIGSFALVFLPEYLRLAEEYRMVIYGLMLVLITIFMPKGIVHAFKLLGEKAVGFVRQIVKQRPEK